MVGRNHFLSLVVEEYQMGAVIAATEQVQATTVPMRKFDGGNS